MKSFKFLISLALIGILLTYTGCKSSSSPGQSETDAQLVKLSKTWKVATVTLDGVAQTGYTSFQLTVNGTAGQTTFGYSTSGRPALSPWPASGTWTFGSPVSTQLKRDDGLPVTYAVTDTQLQLTFTYSGAGFSRVNNVKGNWVYTFGL